MIVEQWRWSIYSTTTFMFCLRIIVGELQAYVNYLLNKHVISKGLVSVYVIDNKKY
jgi:hypothetical protein